MAREGPNKTKTWEDLAREASKETDPQKLLKLVKQLCSTLDERETLAADSQAKSNQAVDPAHEKRTPSSSDTLP
jgi:hypothetical protein